MKKSRQDNSGFSLIELLIAMVIIAIVLTPLYNNFRQSTYLNGKAKAAMDATNMASNVMEGLSAYSAEEIIFGFYTYDSVSNNNPLRHSTLNIMPNEVTVADYGEIIHSGGAYSKGISISSFSPDTVADYSMAQYVNTVAGGAPQPLAKYLQIKPNSSGKYYFYAEGVNQARGTYDVLLVLDTSWATGFSGDEDGNGVINGSETVGYNDYESPVLTNINPMYDGVYTESNNQKANAAADFLTHAKSGVSVTEADLYSYMRRTMTITVKETPDALHGDKITVNVKETYTLTSHDTDFTIDKHIVDGGTIFDSSTYGATPRNIYIYYTGNYNSTASSSLDIFEIENPDSVPINIHLIRVRSSETTDALEAHYKATVNVTEPNPPAGSSYATDIYSNLRDDLTKTAAENVRDNTRGDTHRSTFTINGHGKSDGDSEYDDIMHETGGVRTEKRDRLYGVTMYVYEEGAADAGFPEDMLITEFDGNSAQ